MWKLANGIILAVALTGAAQAQTPAPAPLPPPGEDATTMGLPAEYLPSMPVPQKGQAPTMRVTELNPQKRSFQIIFSRGDEVIQGLVEFANQNKIGIAHFTALGALQSAAVSWFEPVKRIFKTIRLNEPMEVASFIGTITRNPTTGAYIVHIHGSVTIYRNGTVYAGHITEAKTGPTVHVYLDDSAPLAPPPAATPPPN